MSLCLLARVFSSRLRVCLCAFVSDVFVLVHVDVPLFVSCVTCRCLPIVKRMFHFFSSGHV